MYMTSYCGGRAPRGSKEMDPVRFPRIYFPGKIFIQNETKPVKSLLHYHLLGSRIWPPTSSMNSSGDSQCSLVETLVVMEAQR